MSAACRSLIRSRVWKCKSVVAAANDTWIQKNAATTSHTISAFNWKICEIKMQQKDSSLLTENSHNNTLHQGLNHVFKVGGPIRWSKVLLSFYRNKLHRSTQFGAVGYIITLYSSKSYVNSWGSVQILGRSGPSSGCAHG